MASILNSFKLPEEIRSFLSKFNRNEQEPVVINTLMIGISVLSQYSKLTCLQVKNLAKSFGQVAYTEKNIQILENKIKELQNELSKLDNTTVPIEKTDKSTETLGSFNEYSQSNDLQTKKTIKKVDFWNQTENKENLENKTTRTQWKKIPKVN